MSIPPAAAPALANTTLAAPPSVAESAERARSQAAHEALVRSQEVAASAARPSQQRRSSAERTEALFKEAERRSVNMAEQRRQEAASRTFMPKLTAKRKGGSNPGSPLAAAGGFGEGADSSDGAIRRGWGQVAHARVVHHYHHHTYTYTYTRAFFLSHHSSRTSWPTP